MHVFWMSNQGWEVDGGIAGRGCNLSTPRRDVRSLAIRFRRSVLVVKRKLEPVVLSER